MKGTASSFGYAVDGTPADAVKAGSRYLLKERPDLVVSGINHGSNTAINILYSGTVSAATEGTVLGIPSIAVSLTTYDEADFTYAAKFLRPPGGGRSGEGSAAGTLLNVNVPAVSPERDSGDPDHPAGKIDVGGHIRCEARSCQS